MNVLSESVQTWWSRANHRRQVLINRKHMSREGLTPELECEYRLLQKVAEAVMDYSDDLARANAPQSKGP